MNDQQIRSILSDLTEQKAPQAGINLWPAIEARLLKRDAIEPRGTNMNPRPLTHYRLRLATLLILAVVLAGVFFFTTPQGRALAQELLQFITRFSSDTYPIPTDIPLVWVEQTPGAAASTRTPQPGPVFEGVCGPHSQRKCTVEQIRGMVNFPVQELGRIPEGMAFAGATGGPDEVWISYQMQNNRGGYLTLIEQPWTGAEQIRMVVGASAVVEAVKIGSTSGEYAKGAWSYRADGTEEFWDPNADMQTLSWGEDGVFYLMQYFGPVQLDRENLIALAGSLTTEPVSAKLALTPAAAAPTEEVFDFRQTYPLTFVEAERQAGFAVLVPSALPDILSFFGASREYYPPQYKIVSLFYQLDQTSWGPNTNGLQVHEQVIPANGACRLCGFTVGQYTGTEPEAQASGEVVGENAAIETVQVGSATGQYVEGVWSGTDHGWKYNTTPYVKSLRWQVNGIAIELKYFGEEITKEDMVTIAESVK